MRFICSELMNFRKGGIFPSLLILGVSQNLGVGLGVLGMGPPLDPFTTSTPFRNNGSSPKLCHEPLALDVMPITTTCTHLLLTYFSLTLYSLFSPFRALGLANTTPGYPMSTTYTAGFYGSCYYRPPTSSAPASTFTPHPYQLV